MTFVQQMETLRAMADDIESRHGPQNSEVLSLRAAMEALKGTQGYAQQHETDEQTIRVMRNEIRLHRQKHDGEYWAWQGDEEDHPESLTCPVLVPADTVRGWVDLEKAFAEMPEPLQVFLVDGRRCFICGASDDGKAAVFGHRRSATGGATECAWVRFKVRQDLKPSGGASSAAPTMPAGGA